jgi:hypothetical protein
MSWAFTGTGRGYRPASRRTVPRIGRAGRHPAAARPGIRAKSTKVSARESVFTVDRDPTCDGQVKCTVVNLFNPERRLAEHRFGQPRPNIMPRAAPDPSETDRGSVSSRSAPATATKHLARCPQHRVSREYWLAMSGQAKSRGRPCPECFAQVVGAGAGADHVVLHHPREEGEGGILAAADRAQRGEASVDDPCGNA